MRAGHLRALHDLHHDNLTPTIHSCAITPTDYAIDLERGILLLCEFLENILYIEWPQA